jgi:hypothetical protein
VGAADFAGNTMSEPLQLTFATRRRLVASTPYDASFTRQYLGSTSLALGTEVTIGDNAVNNTYRLYMSFDLSALPVGAEVEHAQFSARQLVPIGAPYNIGPVIAQQVTYASTNNLTQLQAMSVPGNFSTNATVESKTIDVTSQIRDDLDHRTERGGRSQYRLLIEPATNNNDAVDRAVFARDTFEMTVVYLVD